MRKISHISYLWIILLTVLCGLILVVYAQKLNQVSSPHGILSGIVVADSSCPEPPGCAAQPVANVPLRISLPNGQVMATVTTDQRGHFTVILPVGSYVIAGGPDIHGVRSTPIRMSAGQTTTVQIRVDMAVQ